MPTGIITYDITQLQGAFANAFLILINTLFFNVKLIGEYNQYPVDASPKLLSEEETIFDFIIVGAGAAGCALANRLSEQDQWSVLLLEAGDYPQTTSAVPALFPTFYESAFETWQYELEKDKDICGAYKNKRCWMTRGRILGGTSSINNLHYFRDYNADTFTDSIFNSIEYYADEPGDIGCKGDIHLEQSPSNHRIGTVLKEAYSKIHMEINNKRNPLGLMYNYLTIKEGERFNMARAFLTPVKSRANFFFAKNAMVDGIVTHDPLDKRVKGVNVTISNIRFFLQARKEVILASGAINNAKLLLSSGIGPREYLQKHKIPVILDLPGVGSNLQAHITVPLFVGLGVDCDECFKETAVQMEFIRDVFDYIMLRTGSLSNVGVHGLTLFTTIDQHPTNPTISIQHNFFSIKDRMLPAWVNGLKLDQTIVGNLLDKNEVQPMLLFLITLLQPKSRGEVHLNHTHFKSNPAITGHFLHDEDSEDLDNLVSGFSLVANLTSLSPLKSIGADILDIGVPDCRNYKFCSMHYVKCYIKNMLYPSSSVAGTTRSGAECDKKAVVKSDFEVKHMRCLRIADSSILNSISPGNTVAHDAMLAVSLSEVLKEKWIKDYVSPFKSVK